MNVQHKFSNIIRNKQREFIILYIYALLLYSPLIVLRLTNSMDGMWDQDDHAAGAAELRIGRWFWPYLDRLRMNVSLDPLPTIVSLAFFVAGILLIVSVLQLRMRVLTYAAAMLFLSSPAVLCQLSYSYMSITFSTSFLLAVLAIWIAAGDRGSRRGKILQVLLSGLVISVMMGCYQASLGVTCVTALVLFLLMLAREEKGGSLKEKRNGSPWHFVLRMLLALILGAALYEAFLQANLAYFHETMSDYNGADAITFSGVLMGLPEAIRHTYSSFRFYYGNSGYHFSALQGSRWFYLLYLVPAAGCIGLVIRGVKKGGWLRGLVMLLGILLLPVFANSFFLLAAGSETMMQMTAGMALTLPLVLCFWAELSDMKILHKGASWILAAGIFLLCYGAAGQAAIDQYAMYVGRQASLSLADNVMDVLAISGVDYTENVVLVYGAPADSPLFIRTELYQKANPYAQYGSWNGNVELNRLCWSHFFEQQLRVNVNYAEGDTLETIYHSPEVVAMPVYPAAGSVANVWGVTVVKVSE